MSKYRNLLLQSAREIFSTKSVDQVTIKEICQHAGVANSTFYYHFKTKEKLMDCLHESDTHGQENDFLSILASPDLLEQTLSACCMCAIRAQRSGCNLTAQYYKLKLDAEEQSEAVKQRTAQEHAAAQALIQRAQQAGVIHNSSPADQLAYAAVRLTSSIIVEWCASNGAFDVLQKSRELLLVLFNIPKAP